MKEAKDLFSKQASNYASFRPTYPQELYQFLYSITKQFHKAWDCGTGNGQVANKLADRFTQVYATDLSSQQIAQAIPKDNVSYSVQRAETTDFADNIFDLVTVGTALHWFDFDAFYPEVIRVGKQAAPIVAWCYGLFRSNNDLEAIIDNFAHNTVGKYWDTERTYVDEEYRNIPFPFQPIDTPKINIKVDWSYEHMLGYLNSWSSVQHYINKEGTNPIVLIEEQLQNHWKPGEVKHLSIPLFIRAGIIK